VASCLRRDAGMAASMRSVSISPAATALRMIENRTLTTLEKA